MRLIDADDVLRFIEDEIEESKEEKADAQARNDDNDTSYNCGEIQEARRIKKRILESPTIDAVPVVHARWVKAHGMMPPEYHHRKQCSMCGGWALQDYFGRERLSHYCPNCGAKMDGGANDV